MAAQIGLPGFQQYAVQKSSGTDEYHTPSRFLEAARNVMGGIDCDPASNSLAQETVQATVFYTASDNGLLYRWEGRVWLNPPYSKSDVFIEHLVAQIEAGSVTEAILLIPIYQAFGVQFAKPMYKLDYVVCLTDERIQFGNAGDEGHPRFSNAFFYFGDQKEKFIEEFSQYGEVLCKVSLSPILPN